jgi:hypothetical protein
MEMEAEGDARARRAGQNQSLFRAVNERLRSIAEGFDLLTHSADVKCECADLDCTEQFSMTIKEYEELRQAPTHFAVRPGHVIPEVERVVDGNTHYVVVEKLGEAARIAEASSPPATER